MGGSKVHCKISGVADLEVEDDEACIDAVQKYLVVLPVLQPRTRPRDRDGAIRSTAAVEELYDIVPANPRQAYDVHKVISGSRRRR